MRKCVWKIEMEKIRKEFKKRGLFYKITKPIIEPSYLALCAHNLLIKLSGKSIIYVIGDSHTTPFKFQEPFIVNNIGQATAHNLIKENSTSNSKNLLKKAVSKINFKKDYVLLVFGEIDCRIHIYYQHKKTNKPISELINTTIKRYGQAIETLRGRKMQVIICGIPPCGRQSNLYDYPYYGNSDERSGIYREFNEKLKRFCSDRKIKFIDLYPLCSDKNGFVIPRYSKDEIHLNSGIIEYVRENIELKSTLMYSAGELI